MQKRGKAVATNEKTEGSAQKMKEFITQYWLEVIFGLSLTGLSFCFNYLLRKYKELAAIRAGVVALLHDRLFQSCTFFIKEGEIPLSVLKNITHIYEAYHNLGGNGTGTEIYERARDLPLKKGE